MDFEQRCTIPVAREALWRFLLDVPQMAACVPGVENITASSDEQYTGRMRVKIGPIHLALQGVMTIQERDQQQWRAVTRAEANDRRVGGGVHITAHMTLIESSSAATELVIRTQARLLGKLGEFGQPVIRKQADAIIAEFARNVAAHFHEATATPEDNKEPGKTPAAQQQEPELEVSPARPFPIKHGLGMTTGLGLAVVLLTTLPLPTAPLLAWLLIGSVTVGMILLGALAESRLRQRWKKKGKTTLLL
jgi:carbon monoxide dehydrogenase subunit G